MMLGMSLSTFTLVHVVISLVGIASGFVVLFGLLTGKRLDGWTAFFLVTTVLTSVTGFGFPFDHLLPSHKVGIISLLVLGAAIVARYPLPCTCLALGLRGGRGDGPVSECLRPGGAILREGGGPESDGPDAIRAAVLGGAARGSCAVYPVWYFRGKKIPPGAGPRGLMERVPVSRASMR